MRTPVFVLAVSLAACSAVAAKGAGNDGPDPALLQEAVKWIHSQPRIHTEYDYVMTVKLRFLLFWVKRDDVGGGYIRLGDYAEDPSRRVVQLLMGSDPAKAPRGINRWGAGTEISQGIYGPDSDRAWSMFFGFIKPSKGSSASGMQRELSAEGEGGRYLFEGIISRVGGGRAASVVAPFYSDLDFDLHDLQHAQQVALNRLEAGKNRTFRQLAGPSQLSCQRASGFLSTVLALIDESLKGGRTPTSLCYAYNAHQYMATLESVQTVKERTVRVALREGPGIQQTYRDVKQAHFHILRQDTGGETTFDILIGTSGALRGVPIQIFYNPNWWFQVVLNLKSMPIHPGPAPDHAASAMELIEALRSGEAQ